MNRYQVTAVRDDEDFEIACDKIEWGTAFVRFSSREHGLLKAIRNDQIIGIQLIAPVAGKKSGFDMPDFAS